MWYAIMGEDSKDSLNKRLAVRDSHLDRLNALVNEGRLLTAGPFPAVDSENPGAAGYSGSLIVAEFDSFQEAQTWADADPYIAAGVYTRVTVKRYKRALP